MMHEEELKDKCALCGRLLSKGSDDSTAGNLIIEEIIQNTDYKFDTQECATMFKRFIDVYGNQFQPFLGDKQYISDPFWKKVLPKEDEIKEIREQEKADQRISISIEDNYIEKKNAAKNKKLEVVSLIKDSFQVQKLIVQLIKSAQEDIALAVPTTATDIFFSSQAQETTSYASSSFSCSVFFQLIKDLAVGNKKLNVKIVTNAKRQKRESGQDTQDILSDLRQDEDLSNIHVKYIEQDYSSLNENMVILVVDRRASLAIELEEKDGKQDRRGELKHKRGSSYRMIKLATYSNNKSTVLSYISIFESLWKEIELNEKITALLEEIKRREGIERDFISMAAHELRAPIQPVLGLAQILQSKKNVDTKEQEELLSVIIRNARRLYILTENLLDLAKIESKTLNLQKETFSLPGMIFDAISDMKSQLSSHQVTVNIEYNDGSTKDIQEDIINDISGKVIDQGGNAFLVKADKTRIMQVISNLLTNAIKFTEKGNIVIGLANKNTNGRKEKGTEEEREVIVSFKDSGTGIAPEIFDKLFEKFVTKSDKGTGLGLFISRKIVETHGGRMWAKNNPEGKGATFAFSLPKPI